MNQLVNTKTFKIVIAAWTCCMLGCLLAFWLVWSPHHAESETLKTKITQTEKEYQLTLLNIGDAAREKRQIKLDQTQNKMNAFVADLKNSGQLSLEISRLAAQIQLAKFSSQSKTEKAFMEIPNCENIGAKYIDVTFEGSFSQFATFLNSLERFEPVIFIDRFAITPSHSQTEDLDRHTINMTLAVLVRKQTELTKSSRKSQAHTLTGQKDRYAVRLNPTHIQERLF